MQKNTQLAPLHNLLQLYLAAAKTSMNFQIEAVSKELTAFSKQHGFLDIAFEMLLHYDCCKEQTILLTSLVKDKFKFDYESMDLEQIKTYYQCLCGLAAKIDESNSTSQKQVAVSLAYIYINLSAGGLVSLGKYLEPLTPKHYPPSDQELSLYSYYFEVLEHIASEIDNSRLVLDDTSRDQAKREALGQQQGVLEMLHEKGQELWGRSKRMNSALVECFTCWVDLSYNADILNSLCEHSLMQRLLEALQTEEEEGAVVCLKVIVELLRSPQENAPIVGYLGINIVNLIEKVEQLVAEKELYTAEKYLELILDFSAKALPFFTAHPAPEALAFLARLVAFTRYNGFSIYEDFVDFWEDFLEELIRLAKQTCEPLSPQLEEVVSELYCSVCMCCRYPSHIIRRFQTASEHAVSVEHPNVEEVYKRREKSSQTFEHLAKLLTHEKYIHLACNKIRELDHSDNSFWSSLEVYLLSLINPLKKLNFLNDDVGLLINTFKELMDESSTPVIVKKTFLKVLRSLMSNQVKNDILIKKLFYYNSTCFDSELLAEQADKTFCKGCEVNSRLMAADIPAFLSMVQLYPNREHIVKGVLHIICSSSQSIDAHLLSTLLLLKNAVEQESKSKRRECMYSLNAAAKFLKDCKLVQNHLYVVKEFVRLSFPFIKRCLANTAATQVDENSEIERAVKLVKHLMRCLQEEFWEFVPQLYETVMQAFTVSPVCSYVYLVEVAITVFWREQAYEPFLLDLYCRFCDASSAHLSSGNIEKYSFLLDDFMGMNKRFFVYNASIVLKSNRLGPLIDQCLEYIGCETPRVAKAAYTFFETIFMAYWREEFIETYNRDSVNDALRFNPNDDGLYHELRAELKDKLHYILAKMLKHLSEIPAELIRDCIYEAVAAEIKAFPEWNQQIWQHLILPLPHDIFRKLEKEDFLDFLAQTQEQDFYVAERACAALQKMIHMMNKRMVTSSKRSKNYDLN